MGKIAAICISKKKGEVKSTISEANFIAGHGIEGDAHAGKWHRQVSLLASESIKRIRDKIPTLEDGAFAENIVVTDLAVEKIVVGDRFKLSSDVLLEVTQIGKECHSGCVIEEITGECIMPKEGIFMKVISGGVVKTGDAIEFL